MYVNLNEDRPYYGGKNVGQWL